MSTPAVSVLLKCYNHERYVAQAVFSVLQQSFRDFELLIADDGSTDRSPEILALFTDPRIAYERSDENRGIPLTVNALLARARGEFVAILNSDDRMLPNRLEAQVAYLRAHPDVAAVFGVPEQIGENDEPVRGLGPLFAIPFAEPNPSRFRWLRHFFFEGNALCAPSAMLRREAYAQTGGYDPRLTALHDLDCWVRLLARHEIHVMRAPLTAFRVRAAQANASAARADSTLRHVFESFHVCKRYRAFEPELLRAIFAEDLERHAIDASGPPGVWLAEIALLGSHAWHPLFALETLYESAHDEPSYRRLRELSAALNPLNVREPVEEYWLRRGAGERAS